MGCSLRSEPSPLLFLSSTDPLAAANRYLGKILKSDQNLISFFESNGAPVAIEIRESLPHLTRIALYYPHRELKFIALGEGEGDGEVTWFIEEPDRIRWEEYRAAKRGQAVDQNVAVIAVAEKLYTFNIQVSTN